MTPPRIIIESPFSGDIARNLAYARACLYHSLSIGEAPIASHLLHIQVLDDNDPKHRALGINAGLAWATPGVLAAFYVDHGESSGMLAAKAFYKDIGIPITLRQLPLDIWVDLDNGKFNLPIWGATPHCTSCDAATGWIHNNHEIGSPMKVPCPICNPEGENR